MPTSVRVPVAVTVTVSSGASPETDASELVRADPSYDLDAEPVVIVSAAGVTVSVPPAVEIFVKFAVTSFPSASRIW